MPIEQALPTDAQKILDFWFGEETQAKWFKSTAEFDVYIHSEFGEIWRQGLMGELSNWQESAKGALALTILFDQLPLNMYRDTEKAFATEQISRDVASKAIEMGFDQKVSQKEKGFFYIPFMHSEKLEDQVRSVALFSKAKLDTQWPKHHKKIIETFGRFPHRNAILGRENTQKECDWLASKGSFKG
jgi:uncharacterized protein (DUF924 family)